MTDLDRAHLKITVDGKPLLGGELQDLAVASRVADVPLLEFTYRDPLDPCNPDRPRPTRHARLVIEETEAPPANDPDPWTPGHVEGPAATELDDYEDEDPRADGGMA